MTAVLAIGAVQDHAANRGVELIPAVPRRSRERLKPAHRARTDCNPDRSLSDYPHMSANLTLPTTATPPTDPCSGPNEEGRQDAAPDGSLLLTGRLVGAANFARSLPKALNLLHREEARQFDVMNGTSGHSDTGYSRCHCGVSHVENHHHTGTIGGPPVHRDKLTPGGRKQLFNCRLAVGVGVFPHRVQCLRCIICRETEQHGRL